MFKITNNKIIKVSKNDTSGYFPINIVSGSGLYTTHINIYPTVAILDKGTLLVKINDTTFINKVKTDGIYKFLYTLKNNTAGWYLNDSSTAVLLADYGISINRTPILNDNIVIQCTYNHPSSLSFYIVKDQDTGEFLVKKTISSNNTIYTYFNNDTELPEVTSGPTVDSNYNFSIHFTPEDLANLDYGEYYYQITAKLYDLNKQEYCQQTLTERLPFIIMGN